MNSKMLTKEQLAEQIAELNECLQNEQLEPNSASFAKDLISYYRSRGFLTEKQEPWIARLIDRAKPQREAARDAPVKQGAGAAEHCESKLYDLFAMAAHAQLQWPSITYDTEVGTIKVFPASDNSKWNGNILFTNGENYPNTLRYAKLHMQDKLLTVFAACPVGSPLYLQLRAIIADPIRQAVLEGHRTSNCCFCGLKLTSQESVLAGYGPICADNWGLPWGAKQSRKVSMNLDVGLNELGGVQK